MRLAGIRVVVAAALLAALSIPSNPPAFLRPLSAPGQAPVPFPDPEEAVRAAELGLDAPGDLASAPRHPVRKGWKVVDLDTLAAGPGGLFRVDRRGLAVAPPGGPEAFRYSFESARVGESLLPAATDIPPLAERSDEVVFRRGGIEERYVDRDGAVEQLFVVPQLAGTGDLVVRGRVSSKEPFDPGRSDGQRLSYGSVFVEKALAFDAAGRTVLCRLAHEGDAMEIRVPGAWVAEATAPVTIDPLIGTLLELDNPMLGASISFRNIDIAYNATNNEYLVVFTLGFSAATFVDYNVYGRRVNAVTGATIGARIDIETEVNARSLRPSVAWNALANSYLVAWAEVTPVDGTVHRIRGRILNGANPAMGTAKFNVSELAAPPAPGEDSVDVAYNNGNGEWLAVWARVDTPAAGHGNIYGRRIPSGGPSAAILSFVIDNTASVHSLRPAVACLPSPAPGSYVVAYSDGPLPGGPPPNVGILRSRPVSDLGVVGAAVTVSPIGGATADHDWPKLAANPENNEYLIVWDVDLGREPADPQSLSLADEIFGRRLGPTGAPLAAPIAIQPIGGVQEWLPEVAWSAQTNEYMVVWTDGNPALIAGSGVQLAIIRGGTNTIVLNNVLISGDIVLDYILPVIAGRTASTEVLVAFLRFRVPVSHWGQRFQTPTPPSGAPPPPPPPVFVASDDDDKAFCSATVALGTGATAWSILFAVAGLIARRKRKAGN